MVPGSCEAGLYGTQIYPEQAPSRHEEGQSDIRYHVLGWYLNQGLQPSREGGYLELGEKYELVFGNRGPRLVRLPPRYSIVST